MQPPEYAGKSAHEKEHEMKKLITTCYARAKSLPRDIPQVQTSRGAPTWWNAGRKLVEHDLAPSERTFLMAKQKAGDWRLEYRKEIERLHSTGKLTTIIDRIPEGSALLCFEGDHLQCHRAVLADFLIEKGLADVKELDVKPSLAEIKEEQAKKQPSFL